MLEGSYTWCNNVVLYGIKEEGEIMRRSWVSLKIDDNGELHLLNKCLSSKAVAVVMYRFQER